MLSNTLLYAVGLLLPAILSPVAAQTFTSCNPLNRTDCPTDQALGMDYTFDFTNSNITSVYNQTAGAVQFGSNGTEFTINQKGDSPTVQSLFYIFFGRVEVHMKAATGQGVISSIVLESDDLDEVDWEFMGGNTTHVETNYFGKGNTTSFDRAIYYPVDNPQENFHNYTCVWTQEKLEWWIDGTMVRTLPYGDANGGKNYPQTPITLRLGIWAGGDSGEPKGTIEWAGGLTDYSKGPYTMYVNQVRVTDGSTGSEYKYGDETGSYQSIQITNGTSKLAQKILAGPPPTLAQRWKNVSHVGKIAVYATGVGVGVLLIALIAFCCVKQRRSGRREHQEWNNEYERQRQDTMAYQMELKSAQQWPGNNYR
jgi:beta-glucanase (GH16 family)